MSRNDPSPCSKCGRQAQPTPYAVTIEMAAHLLGVTNDHLARAIKRGDISLVDVFGVSRVPMREIERVCGAQPADANERAPAPTRLEPGASAHVESRGPSGPGDAMWDAKDVAAFLKASRSWVYLQTNAGVLPHHRAGALLRYDPEQIRAYARGELKTAPRVATLLRDSQ
jgi:predicted DNA-binding transcriptional regulator AlpA